MKFKATLILTGKTSTGFMVPPRMVEALGAGKRPPVNVTLNGSYSYRNTVSPMGGDYWLGVSAEHRENSGVKAGDEIDVELTLDTAPREIVVPADLAAALAKHRTAEAAFDQLSYSHKRQHVLAIEGAKAPETRARRVAKAIEMLTAQK